MNKLIKLTISAILALAITGCATNGIKQTPQQIASTTCGYAGFVVPLSVSAVEQFVLTNPAEKNSVNSQIYAVAANLNSLTSGTSVNATQLATAFKVTSPDLQLILNPIAGAIGPTLTALNNQGTNGAAAAAQIISCISQYLENSIQQYLLSTNTTTNADVSVKH